MVVKENQVLIKTIMLLVIKIENNSNPLALGRVCYIILYNTLFNYRDLIGYLRSRDIK